MKLALASFAAFLFYAGSVAHAEGLSLFLECDAKLAPCQTFPLTSDPGQTVTVTKEPALTLESPDIDDAALVIGEHDAELYQLRLSGAASEKLRDLTEKHVGQRLVIAFNGKALLAPRITAPITSGVVQISTGKNGWDSLPWLRRKAESQSPGLVTTLLQFAAALLLLGLLIGGPILFFSYRRPKAKA